MWKFLEDHGTKLLGIAQGTVAALAAVDGVVPANQLKYWLAASAILTVWRGFENSANQDKKP